MIKSIRNLIIVALIAFLVNSFLGDPSPMAEQAFDSFFTLILLAFIWYNLRHRFQEKIDKHAQSSAPKASNAGESVSPPPPDEPPVQKVVLPATIGGLSVIYHQSPWSVVERGQVLGKFRNSLISAWIRTSDKRIADYVGIHSLPYPEQCSCIEIPEKAELILPPGMVYTIRSS